jgi:hypothetical protein
MAEETPPVPPNEPGPQQLKLTAQGFQFPLDVLQRWVDLPPDEPLVLGPLTKNDLDHLLFSTAKISAAITALQQAFIRYSNGDISGADAFMLDAGNATIEGETHMRMLFFAVMQSVIEGRRHGPR